MSSKTKAVAAALAPFAPPSSFTDEQLLEADRYLAGPARDPQFFNRRTELYEQRRQREAERLELQHQEVASKQIAALQAQLEGMRAEHQLQQTALRGRINNLLALEMVPA